MVKLTKLWHKNLIKNTYSNHAEFYPSPINLNYFWGLGFIAFIVLFSQIITGALLVMQYNAHTLVAFDDLERIMRDVLSGYGLRYVHANGASMFFIAVYIHIARGLYYGSFFKPRFFLWASGIIIFFCMMAAAFMGYVLPWGQMSFWGATVITNMFSAIPVAGESIVQWLWGGFSVAKPTLNRFLSFHYLVPFILLGVAGLHIIFLHDTGSNNPLGIKLADIQKLSFWNYFIIKDLVGIFFYIVFFSYFVTKIPNALGHPDNYIEAQPLVTPPHIVPEWYFLPYYAILRTIPNKLGGVLAMAFSIIILILLPFLETSSIRAAAFKPYHRLQFVWFVVVVLGLTWLGQEVVEYPFLQFSGFLTASYFFFYFSHFFYGFFFDKH